MEKNVNDAYVAMVLKNVYERTNEEITLDAVVSRALTEKITSETINQKVNAQMNVISIGIKNINPKFNEKSKNYDITKAAILDSLTNYEAALVELSQFYDTKIEQMILRKVELESHLLGSLIREEYLFEQENQKIEQEKNDKLKKKISNSFRGMVERITKKKPENVVDVSLIRKATDAADIELEIEAQLNERVEKTKQEKKKNKENIQKIEREIRALESEIQKINERKKTSLLNAMEVRR